MHLSPRLQIIADSISKCKVIADIGSDHAKLPIYLVKNKKTKKAIASDVNPGPASISTETIKKFRMEKYIETRLGYGLSVLKEHEVDIIVISGLGGILIKEILESATEIAKTSASIILQPMRDSFKLRSWLLKNSFIIKDVDIIKDKGKFYETIWVKPGCALKEDQIASYVDIRLINKKNPLILEYIDMEIKKYKTIVNKLARPRTPNAISRLKECNEILEYYKEVKTWMWQNAKQ